MKPYAGLILTEEQSEVVKAILGSGDVVARAGAGSGKTRTLVEAYVLLLNSMKSTANPFDRILAITFTNEAAYNLRKSLFRRSGNDVRALLTDSISTIHSFCNSILASHLLELSINPSYEIADENSMLTESMESIEGIVSAHLQADGELREFISNYGYANFGQNCLASSLLRIYSSLRLRGVMRKELEQLLSRGVESLTAFSTAAASAGDGRLSNSGDLIEFMKRTAGVLGRYLLHFWDDMERRKKEKGLLTFDDVLYYTYQLLRENPDICNHYREKFDYIMVDEFQDTDRLQYSIVSMISRDGKRAFVGDPKQSIYEWRNADPSIMEEVEQDILRLNEGHVLGMNDNFRSAPGLVSFFNLIFPDVFGKGNVEYAPMRCANGELREGAEPSVRILLPGGENAGQRRTNEAELICSEVRRLIDTGTEVFDDEAGAYRKICLRDIAVLFRSRASIWTYERVLREQGIPYIHVQSDSFFEKKEVMDLLNYIYHLARPEDSYYTFATLRSPIYGCSDDILLSLSANRYEMAKTLGTATGDDRKKLQLFQTIDEEYSHNRNNFAHIVLRDIIERTRLDLVYLASGEGKQAYANILRLVDIVRGMESDGPIGIREAARRLEARSEDGRGEAEYPMNDEKSDALRMMTVHASKGLEFPVVFVADSSRSAQPERAETFYHDEAGIIPGVPRRSAAGIGEGIERINRAASDRRRSQKEHEEKRIFYVSLTRAKEILYASLFDMGNRESRSWNGLLSKVVPAFAGREVVELQSGCRIVYIRKGAAVGPVAPGKNKAQWPLSFSVYREPQAKHALTARATVVAEYLVCPYRRTMSEGAFHTTGDEENAAAERGTAVHTLLEAYDYSRNSMPLNADALQAGVADAVQTAGRFVNSDYGRAARDASRSGKLRRETNFGLAVGRHRLSGKIDLFVQAPEELLVVDYKTGDIRTKEPEYRNQLMLYALALKHLHSPPVFRLVTFALDNPAETREYVISPGELESFGKKAEATLDGIAEGSNVAIPTPENCSGCAWTQSCGYAYRKQADSLNNGYHN